MNTASQLQLSRLKRAKQNRYNPLPSITDPTQITRKLDAFEVGYLKDAVNIWDSLEQRDDLIRTVISKRKKSIGRQGWTVLIHDDITPAQRSEAEQHATALEYFYQNLRCENALDRAERGGFKLLCRQMMDAIGKRFAVHEIVWKLGRTAAPAVAEGASPDASSKSAPSDPSAVEDSPSSSFPPFPSVSNASSRPSRSSREQPPQPSTLHPQLTATFRFVPLSFFENTTGDLRYLEDESAVTGTPLQPGAWMITVGEGLMFATATAWILKNLTLNDWLLYSERNGRPGLRGITSATPNSDEWKALESALNEILHGSTVVHSTTDDVKVIDLAAGNHIPFPELVDRIDRHIAALWRGADLSTISRDRGYGASLQEKETAALEEDDAAILTETLNEYVDQWVIRYLFGDDVQPLANVKVLVTPEENTTADLQIDDFLYRTGAPLALVETLNRYGRSLPKPGEATLQVGMTSTASQINPPSLPSSPFLRDLRVRFAPPSYPGSAHPATAHVPNSEDAHDCEMGSAAVSRAEFGVPPNSPVPSRDSSPLDCAGTTALSSEQSRLLSAAETSAQLQITDSQLPVTNSSVSPSLPPFPSVENSDPLPASGGFSPQPSAFTIFQTDWLQLSPYGDFPHPRGLQRVDREAADIMVKRFNSFRGKLGRLFGGAPFYIGHPDTPHASDLADKKAYGWVMELDAREDGIYGRVKWSPAGLDLLKNAHFKYLSPYWEAQQLSSDAGRSLFRPTNLISVGLTNQPNLPVKPLANSGRTDASSVDEAASPEPPVEALSQTLSNLLDCAGTTALSPKQARPLPIESAVEHQSPVTNEAPPLPQLPPLTHVENPCSFAINPSLPPFPSVENSASRLPDLRVRSLAFDSLHTTSITNSIAHRRHERLHFQTRRERLHNAVRSKMRLGLTYDEAWDNIRQENPNLFMND